MRLVPTKRLTPGRKPLPPGAPRAKRPNVVETRNRKLIKRLLEALDQGLKQLEARMSPEALAGAAPASAADAERDARTLSGLARLYAKLVELDEEARGAGKEGEGQAKTEASDDAGQLRRDLALRLQRLNQARDPR